MVACVIQHQGDRDCEVERFDAIEQGADTGGIDIAGIGDRDNFLGDSVDRPEDVEALPAAGGFNPDTSEAPQRREKGAENKMGGINKEHGAFPGLSFDQPGLQCFF